MDIASKIRLERKRLNLTQAGFAKLLGTDQSTISRWETGKQKPEVDQRLTLADKLGRTLNYFAVDDEPEPPAHSFVTVRGHVQAGDWREEVDWHPDEQKIVLTPADGRFPEARRFAVEVRGDSMNLLFKPGTVLVCISLFDIGRSPEPGEKVIVHRRDKAGLVEVTCKEFIVTPDGDACLMPRSSNPKHKPIMLAGLENGEDEPVTVVGLVIQSIRTE